MLQHVYLYLLLCIIIDLMKVYSYEIAGILQERTLWPDPLHREQQIFRFLGSIPKSVMYSRRFLFLSICSNAS